ncbi:prepilin-type N-terminal cleavage/methylation domain-containing protein [Protaetiibacter intestinalis]|uniref:Prepilin-type N-terminal cleavage/methylation domain-containing protein n=1 Tax=Protaetiibacter intestinalis TaxID=2419774 RepID=A0A387B731_9MICO|nr:prepilin-type N-terminal cleavage/methylation domain-containing protein [Protaetiibacter intestinalis]AYF97581.1 prepilin-type N-terminal cleavage/methylation domain-containing protein [Protaetiibacter intestinalis]
MSSTHDAAQSDRPFHGDESGFTLIEVVVAVVMLVVITAAALAFAIQGLKGSHAQERVEIATTVATRAMEAVRAYNIIEDPSSHKSSIYNGRTQAAVQAAWTANSTVAPAVASTYAEWDTAIGTGETEALPISQNVVFGDTTYTVVTLVGKCFVPATGDRTCGLATGYTNAQGGWSSAWTVPSGATEMMRATVIVKWTAGEACAASGCTYTISNLIEPKSIDLAWRSGS